MAPLITLALSSGPLGNIAWTLGPLSLVAAAGIAVFKYRLYDIDVVINKTVVFGALAAFITAVYAGIVVGIGPVIGQGSKPNLGLSILATAVVAVAFQPVRERVQRLANRLVYGRRGWSEGQSRPFRGPAGASPSRSTRPESGRQRRRAHRSVEGVGGLLLRSSPPPSAKWHPAEAGAPSYAWVGEG